MTNDSPPPPHHAANVAATNLNKHLNTARENQQISWNAFARKIGISTVALTNIRFGRSNPHQKTIERIEDAAGWPPGGYKLARQDKDPMQGEAQKSSALSSRLNFLLKRAPTIDENEHSPERISNFLKDRKKIDYSAQEIYAISEGVTTSVPDHILEGIAEYFQITKGALYFHDDTVAKEVEAETNLLHAIKDKNVQRIATRIAGLSDRSVEPLMAMIEAAAEVARKNEGISPALGDDDKD
jgi:transcriptional regulator with XRE-family HTH domain